MKRSQKMFAVLFLGSSLTGAGAAMAAPPRGVPTVQASEVREELRELKKLERLQDRFAIARARNDRSSLKQVEAELRQYLELEIGRPAST